MTDDLISRQQAIDALKSRKTAEQSNAGIMRNAVVDFCIGIVKKLPSAQPETCEGCKHLGKWENEVEYGYPSPCTRCKRRVNDNYER